MSDEGLEQARKKMEAAGVDPVAIDVFAHYYRLVESGETGMVPESTIDPLDMEALADVDVPDEVAREAIGSTVVVKLNGGLGTSMGMDRAKSLLCVRRGLSFLDIIARQTLHLRKEYDAPLPLIFMNSFRTSADTMDAIARYDDLPVEGLPLEFLQNKEPKLRADDLTPSAANALLKVLEEPPPEVVFVLGLAEKVFPPRVLEDSLLPDDQRRALGPNVMLSEERVAHGDLHDALRALHDVAFFNLGLAAQQRGAHEGGHRPQPAHLVGHDRELAGRGGRQHGIGSAPPRGSYPPRRPALPVRGRSEPAAREGGVPAA